MEESLKVIRDDLSYFMEDGTSILYLYQFPVEWKTQDIYNNLSIITPFKIKWLDDSSCFLKINTEKCEVAERIGGAGPDFKLIPLENQISISGYFAWKANYVPKKKEYKKEYRKESKKEYNTPKTKNKPNSFIRKEVIKVTAVKNENATDVEKLVRSVNGMLNKLSDTNFEKLSAKIVDILESDNRITQNVVNIIYEKAIDGTTFISLYARLCCKLKGIETFKERLVGKCQEAFQIEKTWTDDSTCRSSAIKLNPSEMELTEEQQLETKRGKLKRRILGNVQFICNLFLQGLISKSIIDSCIKSLMLHQSEENIEILCNLIEVVRAKVNCDIYLNTFKLQLTEGIKHSPRVKILVLNLVGSFV